MKRLEIKGINFTEVTLHVGLGTFNPIEVEDLSKHKMECEEAIRPKTADIINKAAGKPKNLYSRNYNESLKLWFLLIKISAYQGWTNKFIYPPYDFLVQNAMITNFHTPKSTLIMMIAAFAGRDFCDASL